MSGVLVEPLSWDSGIFQDTSRGTSSRTRIETHGFGANTSIR